MLSGLRACRSSLLLLLLCHHLLAHLLLLHSLRLDALDVLRDREACFLRFSCYLLLHQTDLLRRRLLARLQWLHSRREGHRAWWGTAWLGTALLGPAWLGPRRALFGHDFVDSNPLSDIGPGSCGGCKMSLDSTGGLL